MLNYQELLITEKITKTSFYIPCNSEYFNQWAKFFILSAKELVPWIHLHCHIFDMTENDKKWCIKNSITYSYENTPENLKTLDEKKGFWVNVRFCRVPEIFEDNVTVMCVDADSVIVRKIEETEFINDTNYDWVVVREKGEGSIGSCVLFSKNQPARFIVKQRILSKAFQTGFVWYLDQIIFDELLEEKILQPFSMKYSDYQCKEQNKIWTGKGTRKFKKKRKKRRYADIIEDYKIKYVKDLL